ncbi:MAG: hypothetical protein ABSE68_00885 [Minisyncoccia bacterium]
MSCIAGEKIKLEEIIGIAANKAKINAKRNPNTFLKTAELSRMADIKKERWKIMYAGAYVLNAADAKVKMGWASGR